MPVIHPDGSRPLSVRALEEELKAMWTSVAQDRDPTGGPVMRAALLTLIAVVDGDEAARRMTLLISRLMEQAPCRALLVQLDPSRGSEEPLAAYVSVHCHKVGARQVCCEQITIRSAPAGDPHLSSLVLPLLVPDLPVVLHWPEVAIMMAPAAGSHELARGAQFLCDLDPFVDQLILDSALAVNPVAWLSRVLALAGRPAGPGMRPVDLNWIRLLPWREALADAVDRCAIDPAAIRTATIGTVVDPTTRAAAPGADMPVRPRLLAGWLRERLASATGGAFRAVIRAEVGPGPPGRIVGVTLTMADGTSMAVLVEPDALAVTHGADAFRFSRPPDTGEDVLCGAIGRRETDPYFARAVGLAADDGTTP